MFPGHRLPHHSSPRFLPTLYPVSLLQISKNGCNTIHSATFAFRVLIYTPRYWVNDSFMTFYDATHHQVPSFCRTALCLDYCPIKHRGHSCSAPSLCSSFPSQLHIRRAFPTFRWTTGQLSSSDRSNILPRYFNFSNSSIHSASSSYLSLKDAFTHRLVVATSLL